MSLLLVEKSDAGVSVGKHEDKLGIRLSDTADFVMEDVFVPADRLIGTEGNGFAQTMKFLAGKRPVSVAGAVGVAQRALDLAVDYARERSFKHGRSQNSRAFSSDRGHGDAPFRPRAPWRSTARR